MRPLQCGVLFVAIAASVWGQDKRPRIQVQKYTIDAEINPRTQSISATARISFIPLENTSDATFELNAALRVSKVVDNRGTALGNGREGQDQAVHVNFPAALVKNQPSEIAVTYDGKLTGEEESPINGIKFAALHPDYGYLLYPARWFPVSGYTVDRFSADLRVTTH